MQSAMQRGDFMDVRIAVIASLLGLAPACGDDEELSPREADLERAREVTAKYRDIAVAEADGFVREGECVFDPVRGTMGVHYARTSRVADPALEVEEPEALLYLEEHGKPRLVAIEYVQLIVIDGAPYLGCGVENNSCPPENPPPPPSLYHGVVFDGPMAGHAPGMPWHYDLHVWIWADNPAGMFAQYNPSISCE